MKSTFEKSVVAAFDLPRGHIIERSDLRFKKPGFGIPAKEYKSIVGRKVVNKVKGNTRIELSDYE